MITPYQELLDSNAQGRPGSTSLQHGQFLSRVFTDASGRQFRLTFFVTIVAGEARGHLVSAQPVSTTVSSQRRLGSTYSLQSDIFCLPIACPKNKPETVYVPFYAPEKSPYFSLDFLINSQPTRAPSCK